MKKMMHYLRLATCVAGMLTVAHAQNVQPTTLAAGTAVPVSLSHSIDTAKTKPGDTITAKTMQLVHAGEHQEIPRGSLVTGHVVAVMPYNGSAGQAATVVLQFDRIRIGSDTVHLRFSARAIASSYRAYDAEYLNVPQSQLLYAHALIGGGRTTPGSNTLYSDQGDTIGYENKDGRYGALLGASAQDAAGLRCEGTGTPQALAIFSPSACGIYGFDHVTMEMLTNDPGAVQLTARQHNIVLFSGSAMLLQIEEILPQIASR